MEKEIKELKKEVIKGNIFVMSLFAILIPILPIQAILVLDHCLSASIFVITLSLYIGVFLYNNIILSLKKSTFVYLFLKQYDNPNIEIVKE